MGITEIIKEKMNEPMSIFFKEYDYDGEYSYICIRPQYLALKQGGAYMFKLRLPKIPADIYNCIVSLFSKVAQLYNIECLARVYWDISWLFPLKWQAYVQFHHWKVKAAFVVII